MRARRHTGSARSRRFGERAGAGRHPITVQVQFAPLHDDRAGVVERSEIAECCRRPQRHVDAVNVPALLNVPSPAKRTPVLPTAVKVAPAMLLITAPSESVSLPPSASQVAAPWLFKVVP